MSEKLSAAFTRKLIEQAQREITYARRHKAGRLIACHKNEAMYYGRKQWSNNLDDTYTPLNGKTNGKPYDRFNVMLPKMQGFVDTLLSKVDSPPIIKYGQQDEADLIKAQLLTAFYEVQSKTNRWDFKDLLLKKNAILYGRAHAKYFSESLPGSGYRSYLEIVDFYDFLIDPNGGGEDTEHARNLGANNIYLSEAELRTGVKEGYYIKSGVDKVLKNAPTGGSIDEEEEAKQNRFVVLNLEGRMMERSNDYKFFEWCTTSEADGKRYYLLFDFDSGVAIRAGLLRDEVSKSDLWPYMSWATNPDAAEHWTPGPADAVREIFMAQTVAVNQMLDNADLINDPYRFIDTSIVQSPSLLRSRRNRLIPLKKGADATKAVHFAEVPPIETSEKVYNMLDSIAQLESGVTAATRGSAEEEKVGIYEGNQQNVSDRLGLYNKSYAQFYVDFGTRFMWGSWENMTTKQAVQMIGIKGIEYKQIKKSDITPTQRGRQFDVLVTASDAALNSDVIDKRNKITFLREYKGNAMVNQKEIFSIMAQGIGLTEDQISALLDPESFGEAELMSEAARDIQVLLSGSTPKPNRKANVRYMRKLVDYAIDNEENMSEDTFTRFDTYLQSIREVVQKNAARELAMMTAAGGALRGKTPGGGPGAAPNGMQVEQPTNSIGDTPTDPTTQNTGELA